MTIARLTPRRTGARLVSLLLAGALIAALIGGCSSPNSQANAGSPAPYSSPAPAPAPAPSNGSPLARMTTKQKVAVLVGAAALYYMYKKHQAAQGAQGAGAQGVYYRSKNGGVYYRDAQGNPHWVTPPEGGIQVPADEAAQYRQGAQQNGFSDAVPAGSPGGGY